jgi:dTDP-4-dehydrorhamnose reductase
MVYAETKVEGERIVGANPRHLIIRTSLNYGHTAAGNRSFNEEMVEAWRQGRTLRLFTDEFRSPIAATETASALLEMLTKDTTGIVHVAGTERLSRWEIGRLVAARHPEVHPRLEPSSLGNYSGPPRPPDVSLDCSRAEAILGHPLPRFTNWLRRTNAGNGSG